ncbi:methionyl-tRNA formyltransferase [Luteolibacter sp. AS25]|uniref:methionyl-tRNA formyltransferase n=1 Tax=Luteolibacter sp. AS25 TaxID=3135776 RepID=UPI00398A5AA3
MTIAFIATGDIALPTFRHLIDHGPKPCLLITQPDKPVGRSQSSTVPPEIKTVALAHDIPVWQPEKIKEVGQKLTEIAPDFIVVMAYGQIIGKVVREAASKAIINLHASILPKYRGASCIQSAINNGDAETGITIMHIIRELDAGDIICTKKIRIGDTETAGELHDRLAELGPSALSEALEILEADPSAGTPQKEAEVTYSPKLLRENGRLDFSQSAELIEQTIRAYHPWPGTFTEVEIRGKSKRLKIFPPAIPIEFAAPQGELVTHEGELLIGCGGNSLKLASIQPEGSKQMPASALANSLS